MEEQHDTGAGISADCHRSLKHFLNRQTLWYRLPFSVADAIRLAKGCRRSLLYALREGRLLRLGLVPN